MLAVVCVCKRLHIPVLPCFCRPILSVVPRFGEVGCRQGRPYAIFLSRRRGWFQAYIRAMYLFRVYGRDKHTNICTVWLLYGKRRQGRSWLCLPESSGSATARVSRTAFGVAVRWRHGNGGCSLPSGFRGRRQAFHYDGIPVPQASSMKLLFPHRAEVSGCPAGSVRLGAVCLHGREQWRNHSVRPVKEYVQNRRSAWRNEAILLVSARVQNSGSFWSMCRLRYKSLIRLVSFLF